MCSPLHSPSLLPKSTCHRLLESHSNLHHRRVSLLTPSLVVKQGLEGKDPEAGIIRSRGRSHRDLLVPGQQAGGRPGRGGPRPWGHDTEGDRNPSQGPRLQKNEQPQTSLALKEAGQFSHCPKCTFGSKHGRSVRDRNKGKGRRDLEANTMASQPDRGHGQLSPPWSPQLPAFRATSAWFSPKTDSCPFLFSSKWLNSPGTEPPAPNPTSSGTFVPQ